VACRHATEGWARLDTKHQQIGEHTILWSKVPESVGGDKRPGGTERESAEGGRLAGAGAAGGRKPFSCEAAAPLTLLRRTIISYEKNIEAFFPRDNITKEKRKLAKLLKLVSNLHHYLTDIVRQTRSPASTSLSSSCHCWHLLAHTILLPHFPTFLESPHITHSIPRK